MKRQQTSKASPAKRSRVSSAVSEENTVTDTATTLNGSTITDVTMNATSTAGAAHGSRAVPSASRGAKFARFQHSQSRTQASTTPTGYVPSSQKSSSDSKSSWPGNA